MTERLDPREVRIPIAYLRLILAHFGSKEASRADILEGSGLSEARMRDGTQVLTLEELQPVQDNLARRFGEDWAISAPDLWAHSTYGALSLASQSAPNLHQALGLITSSSATIGPLWRHSLHIKSNCSKFIYGRNVNMEERYWRWGLEVGFVGLKSLLYLYLSRPPTEARFMFECDSPRYADRLKAVLGTEVVFNAEANAVEFPTSWLRKVSPLQNPTEFRLANWQLEAESTALSLSGPIKMRVQRLLQAKHNGRSTLPETAALLGFSERTLARRLSEENTSFRALIDAELRQRAEGMLRLRTLKVGEIAEQLGYSDAPSFARARRRWANIARVTMRQR